MNVDYIVIMLIVTGSLAAACLVDLIYLRIKQKRANRIQPLPIRKK